MRKKIFVTIVLLLLFVSTNVYAGDIPESIMLGKQKALFIGKITTINKDTYSIIPSTVMMGSMQQTEIQIKKFDKYYGTNNKPKVDDFIVAVLLDKNKVDDTWVFKSTSDDYKTLKLVSESYDMVVRYEKYINEGKYFEAQKEINEDNKVSITSALDTFPLPPLPLLSSRVSGKLFYQNGLLRPKPSNSSAQLRRYLIIGSFKQAWSA